MINGSGETFGFFPLNPNSIPTIVPLSCNSAANKDMPSEILNSIPLVLGYCHLVAIPHHQASGSTTSATISDMF